MEMQFKNEIKKLADIVVWADGWIEGMRDGMTEEEFAEDEEVKAFEAVKKVVLESIDRHTVYTNALNSDIAAKAAKIDLMQKELDGRKAGYVALKAQLDTKYISIDAHNDICKAYEDRVAELEKELADCKVKIRHQKESLDGINKTLEIRTKEKESLIAVRNNQDREIEAHESENARLSEKIIELKRTIEKCKDYDNSLIDSLRINNDDLKEQVEYLKKELEDTYWTKEADLKNHNKRDMTLVDELAKKNDEIKDLKGTIEYYKNQERIRTDQLRATESKVEELYGSIHRLTLNCRAKNTEIARLTKEHSDIRHELAKRTAELEFNKEDDHGRAGFKRYIEHLIEEEERAVPERFKARLNEEITAIFEEEEETEVNDIPCGEDSIE